MYQQGGVKVDRLISEQSIVDVLKKGYWNKNLQSAKDDPCIIDAIIDWAIRQIKVIPSAEPNRNMEEIEEVINCDADAEIKCKMISNIVHSKPHYFKTLEQKPKTDKAIEMRDATPEERESIDKYIKSISKPTGVDFWDLEQEPCEDAISREDVIALVQCSEYELQDRVDNDAMCDDVRKLRPVKPQPCDDAISRQAVLDILKSSKLNWIVFKRVNDLPSVNLQEITGYWVAQDIHNCHTDFKCSECGYIHNFMHLYGEPTADYTYCPNCGARMLRGDKA